MKWKWLTVLALAAVLLVGAPLFAQTGGGITTTGAAPTAAPVPEIDPGSLASALTLLTGGVLLVRSRRRAV